MFKLAFIILLVSCSRHVTKMAEQNTPGPCNNNHFKQLRLYPSTYHATEIFLGASDDSDYLHFINLISAELKEDPLKLNLILPSNLKNSTNIFLSNIKNENPNVNLISASAIDTRWAQDYFEIFYNTKGNPQIIDLPYINRPAEKVPKDLATKLNLPLLASPEVKIKNNDGNFGGNIEPLSDELVVVGDSISPDMLDWLKNTLDQKILKLSSNWLATGHIDELFAIIPLPNGKFKLAYSSPKLAIDLINNDSKQNFKNLTDFEFLGEESFNPDKYFFKQCLSNKKENCPELFKANLQYEKIIQNNITQILKNLKLTSLDLIALPVLFIPVKKKKHYGQSSDMAESFNPNLTNFISLNQKIVMPTQSYLPFKDLVEKQISDLNLKLIWAPARFAQTLSGGLHCSSQVLRRCY